MPGLVFFPGAVTGNTHVFLLPFQGGHQGAQAYRDPKVTQGSQARQARQVTRATEAPMAPQALLAKKETKARRGKLVTARSSPELLSQPL